MRHAERKGPVAALKNPQAVACLVPAEAAQGLEGHRNATMDGVTVHLRETRAKVQPVLDCLKDKQVMLTLTVEIVVAIHDEVLDAGDVAGRTGVTWLEGAPARVDNRLAYGMAGDMVDLAAAYAVVIAQGRCFNDGNRRTAFRAMNAALRSLLELAKAAAKKLVVDGVLTREVVVERRRPHSQAAGDLVEAEGRHPVLAHHRAGDAQDVFDHLVAVATAALSDGQ